MPPLGREQRLQPIGNLADVRVPHALKVQPLGEFCSVLRRGIGPIGLVRFPVRAQPLLMGVAVLDDEPQHPVGTRQRQIVGDGRPEVVDVEEEALEADFARQGVDRLSHGVERVRIIVGRRREAESGQIGRHHPRHFGQGTDDVTKAVRRAGLAVEQEHPGCIAPSCLAVEQLHAVHVDRLMLGLLNVQHTSLVDLPGRDVGCRLARSIPPYATNARGRRWFAPRRRTGRARGERPGVGAP
jgi:hypothetical protein